ncbi:hypothetical protein RhiXN_05749 [Rhizoctonia solani]|uniref:Chromo domain-containing protein n=1 Tax=Rhizoctonia solani TaxID=456999 RepID=A0A8H8NY15_9AGAM|nr:uncharacterized protein RhiXN_05749 [Rhizoctonia solani]QRW20760.1 hypothetical protein RhiXN_05749 [Rhizoctonia solani]
MTTPFKALYGWEPTLTPSNVPTSIPEANDLATQMEAQWREELEIGEEAWLDAKNIKLKTLSPKLMEQQIGLFKVIEKVSNRAYCLELPLSMQIHNVFYMGLLSKVKRDKNQNFKSCPPPETIDGKEEYEVEGITDEEEHNGKWFFRVKWKGYRLEENTWEPWENLKNAGNFLKKCKEDMKKKALGAAKALKEGQCCIHNQYQGIYSHFLNFKQR